MNLKSFCTALFALFLSGMTRGQGGKWELLQASNAARECSECGMAALNGKLYLLGGDGEDPRAVQRLDPATMTWTQLAMAPVVMHHFQAVAYQEKIYVLDAFSSGQFPDQVPMPNVYSYNTATDRWQAEGKIPAERRRAGAAAVVYRNKLYLVAGIQHGHSSGTTDMFDCYDPATKSWTALPNAPHIRDHGSAAVIKDKLYLVGGRNTSFRDPENKVTFFSKTILDVDVYDFKSGKWSTLPARLPLGSGGGAVVNLNDVLYYMGGERATETEPNAPRKNTFYLNPLTSEQWTETDSLHFARNGMAAAVWNNKIYIAGGSGGPGGPGGRGGPGGPGGPGIALPSGNPAVLSQGQQGKNLPKGPMVYQPVEVEVFILNQ